MFPKVQRILLELCKLDEIGRRWDGTGNGDTGYNGVEQDH